MVEAYNHDNNKACMYNTVMCALYLSSSEGQNSHSFKAIKRGVFFQKLFLSLQSNSMSTHRELIFLYKEN